VSANERAPGLPRTLITSGVVDAAAGDDRVCAIVGDAAQCVGVGGQTGSRDYQQLHPVPYTEIEHGVSSLAVGHLHACAVAARTLLCWGDVPFDASDQGGRLTRTATPVPVIEHDVTAVAAGTAHDCAIVDGALWCWGDNTHGQIGIGLDALNANLSPNLPQRDVALPSKKAKKAKSARLPPRNDTFADGAQQCSAPAGRVESCWVSRPVRVIERGVTRVFAKDNESCALVDGALYCWGDNAVGQLGVASRGEQENAPTRVLDGSVSEVALSGTRTCALVNGALQCTRRCVRADGGLCRAEDPGFDAKDLAFGVSDVEARLGVWRGTLGTQAVSVCLQRSPLTESAYYYVRHRTSIALNAVGADGTHWDEGTDEQSTGTWQLEAAHGDHLDGTWSAPAGASTLPIRLTRVHVDGEVDRGCGRFESGPAQDAYNAPRVAATAISESVNGDGERTLTAFDKQVSVVNLPANAPHAAEFNAAMHRWLDEQIGEYYGCADAVAPNAAYFNQQRVIELRAGNWLVLRESYDLDCGGAHPSEAVSYQTWDLANGKVVEPWTWIRGSKVECSYAPDCGDGAPAKLNAIILAAASRNKEGDECADAVNENSGYGLRPSATGLVFTTAFAHVIQACDEDIEVPYAQLVPFLTERGKAQLQSFIDAASKH